MGAWFYLVSQIGCGIVFAELVIMLARQIAGIK